MTNNAGKGDKDRSTFKLSYKNNYEKIKWNDKEEKPFKFLKNKKVFIYK